MRYMYGRPALAGCHSSGALRSSRDSCRPVVELQQWRDIDDRLPLKQRRWDVLLLGDDHSVRGASEVPAVATAGRGDALEAVGALVQGPLSELGEDAGLRLKPLDDEVIAVHLKRHQVASFTRSLIRGRALASNPHQSEGELWGGPGTPDPGMAERLQFSSLVTMGQG